jgi:hypothetical protein
MEAYKEEQEAFLEPQQERNGKPVKTTSLLGRLWPYLRLLVEVVMVMCIFVLSTSLTRPESADTLRKSPIPKCKP